MTSVTLLGCDFTSAPSRRKPVTLAVGRADRGRVVLEAMERFDTLDAWAARLTAPGPWVGGFDLPFGLLAPRALAVDLSYGEAAIGFLSWARAGGCDQQGVPAACRRIQQHGHSVACAEDVFIHHHLSASFNKLRSADRQALFEQNKALYEAKWGPWVPHSYRSETRK